MSNSYWSTKLEKEIKSLSKNDVSYLKANSGSVAQVIHGLGPAVKNVKLGVGAGAKIVFNISCVHIPKFCEASRNQNQARPYKNAYDIAKENGRTVNDRRVMVDEAIETATSSQLKKEDIYFGAVETSGTGVRFYGDMCLVLSKQANMNGNASDIYVLDRNSYDVIREPISSQLEKYAKQYGKNIRGETAKQLRKWIGSWNNDLVDMAALKAIAVLPTTNRRWTTGQIADAILQDEDYLEVLYPESFGVQDLLEVRVSAADAAAEADIADREAMGESPALHELEWRQQRREARRELAQFGIRIRVVVTTGRMKGN